MAESNLAGGGNVEAVSELDALNAIGARRAGSEPERRAARHLEQRLEDFGHGVEVEPTRIRTNFALAHLIHVLVGTVASVLAVHVPLAGFALALATTVSAFGDLTGSFTLIRSLTPARASQNVVAGQDR